MATMNGNDKIILCNQVEHYILSLTIVFSSFFFVFYFIFQITLDSFTIGKFTSYSQDGCPDGYLQISEQTRINVGGMWCGTSWGPSIIYSETRTLILAVKLFKYVPKHYFMTFLLPLSTWCLPQFIVNTHKVTQPPDPSLKIIKNSNRLQALTLHIPNVTAN